MPCRPVSRSDFISAAMTKTIRMSNRTEAVGQATVFVTKMLISTVQQFTVASQPADSNASHPVAASQTCLDCGSEILITKKERTLCSKQIGSYPPIRLPMKTTH